MITQKIKLSLVRRSDVSEVQDAFRAEVEYKIDDAEVWQKAVFVGKYLIIRRNRWLRNVVL